MKNLLQIGGFVIIFLLIGVFFINTQNYKGESQNLAQENSSLEIDEKQTEDPSEFEGTEEETGNDSDYVAPTQSNQNVETEETQVIERETFENRLGVWSVEIESDWFMSAGDLGARFLIGKNDPDRVFISIGVTSVWNEVEGAQSTEVLFGSNKYDKYRFDDTQLWEFVDLYRLLIGTEEGTPVFLTVTVESQGNSYTNEIASILSSISVDTSKVAAVVKKEDNKAIDANITARVMQLRKSAENYSDENNYSYAGLCEWSNKNLDSYHENLFQLISSDELSCASNKDGYLYYVDLPGGETFCVDGTGFTGHIKIYPIGTTCE